ncbi:MAG: hypothetical protein P1U32_01135 [Legionellaceae bacterium]|nr:hypothetical protein [Legionellaceae bacterium]
MPTVAYEAKLQEAKEKSRLLEAYEAYLEAHRNQLKEAEFRRFLEASQSEDNCMLHFLSENDAHRFLEQLAEDNEPFLFTKYPPTGEFMLSAGDGELIQGTLDEELLDQLSEHLRSIIDDPEQLDICKEALQSNDDDALRELLRELSDSNSMGM